MTVAPTTTPTAAATLAAEREGPAVIPAILLACIAFVLIRGVSSLDPTNILWIDMNDRAMHSLGWWFFRAAPWGWPPGASPDYGIEISSSIALVDGLPLLAIPFKLLGDWLPEYFQYWGWWHLACFILQAVFAVSIAHELKLNRVLGLVAALFCILQPAFLARLDVHLALSGHWVILAAIWLYVKVTPPPRWAWPLLLATVSAIHGYLLVMVFAIWVASLTQRLWLRTLTPVAAATEAVAGAVVIAAMLWACGIFMVGSVESFEFGRWRMNLLGPFNPDFWSLVLPGVETNIDEWEGANYLGIGVFALAGLAFAGPGIRQLGRLAAPRWLPIAAVAIAMGLFSLSNKIALGSIELIEIPLPEQLERFFTIFRSTGRFFWPLLYLIDFAVLAVLARRFSPRWAMTLGIVFVFAQMLDEQRGWRGMFVGESRTGTSFRTPFTSPAWAALAPHYQRVRGLPARNDVPGWRDLSWFALQNHMATAAVYLGRTDPKVEAYWLEAGRAAMRSGELDTGAIYSVTQAVANILLQHLGPDDLLAHIDGHIIFARGGKAHLAAAGIVLEPYRRPRAIDQ